MRPQPTRRTALNSLAGLAGVAGAAGAVVTGFHPSARAWATDRDSGGASHGGSPPWEAVPPLDGTLHTDDAARAAAADDFGHIVHRTPAAVLRPGSVDDIVTMVRYCGRHRIPVAPRGQAHATHGQAQTEAGLVIKTSPLADIGPVRHGSAGHGSAGHGTVTVGAGAKWSDVTKATLASGLTPPVFTDYLELSVGGTLSVGGLGGQTHQHGAQTDTVTELQVVTGAGELVRCSPTRHRDLFDAVRAGLGQCAIIVSATLRLVRAPRTVRHYLLPYTDLGTFLADQRLLVEQRRFSYVEGQIAADDTGAYRTYLLEAVAYGPPAGPEPDDELLLHGLRFDPAGKETEDLDYYSFLDRLGPVFTEQKESGLWDYAHPWLNLLLPGDATESLAGDILRDLTPDDVGPGGVVLLYPLQRKRLHTELLRMPPHDPTPYLLAVLRACPPDDHATVRRLLAANRTAYEAVRDHCGKRYPVGSIPTHPHDWPTHFGPTWPAFRAAKHRYDPHGVLTPGQRIFSDAGRRHRPDQST
ncbi:FAD-binding protein [Streptomyces sp. N2-109]|uniref:FAD-binding protein n=1 Tax=Streptomyces gossypii TaxID=2883101 RepID=A0ABT2JX91_9ACTN|nr:FAD-binding protein [Streptomyces gossypii]MCT2592069.1 FAD-binding protein [Streptomyces gossypii]